MLLQRHRRLHPLRLRRPLRLRSHHRKLNQPHRRIERRQKNSLHTPRMKSDAHDLSVLEDVLGHSFRRRDLLEQALTHASYARELEAQNVAGGAPAPAPDNEQMEFLGDAVLSFVVSQELFRRFPEYQEGELSKLRAHIVSARRLLRPARELNIGDYLRLGRGEERSGGRNKSALLVNALEAIIAALFLDAGLDAAHRFILRNILEPELAEVHKAGDTH